ncbi:MAG: DUF3467 domain-containing protein [Egibacteraceae bacterium]
MSEHGPPAADGEKPGERIKIQVDDATKFGVYANFLVVSHSAHEFTLDFCQVMPSGGGSVNAEVVTRVKVAPTMVGKVIRALDTNMSSYEDKYGLVREVG